MSNWTFRITGRPSTKNNKTHFGRWLKLTLHSHKITIKDFAKEIGVDKANLYNYVSGRSLPSLAVYFYVVNGIVKLTGKDKKEILTNSFDQISKDI